MIVQQKHTESPCILGYSFGYDKTRIWVNEGCGANFTIEQCLPGTCKFFKMQVMNMLKVWSNIHDGDRAQQ